MDIEVLQRKENPLLKRVEVTFKAVHKAEPTPTRDALRAELAKALKATKDIVVVDHAASTFGRYETVGYAKIYKSKDQAVATERAHILVRNKLVEAEEKAPEPAAEKPPKPEGPAKEEKPAAKKEEKAEPKPEAKPEKAKVEKPEKAAPKEAKKDEKKAEGKPEKAAKPEKPEKKAEPKKKEGK